MTSEITAFVPKRRARRWLQLSLRGLLLLVLIAAVALGWVKHKVDAIKQQDEAIKRLAAYGGNYFGAYARVFHDDQAELDEDGVILNTSKKQSARTWLGQLADGDDSDVVILQVDAPSEAYTIAMLAEVKYFPKLRHLTVWSPVDDAGLRQILACSRLQYLVLNHSQITDAGLLEMEGLSHLRRLHMSGGKFTTTGINQLQRAMPETVIEAADPGLYSR